MCTTSVLSIIKMMSSLSLGFATGKMHFRSLKIINITKSHREAMFVVSIPGTTRDVGELLSIFHAKEKAESREILKIILSSIQYLVRTRADDKPSLLIWMEISSEMCTCVSRHIDNS